MSLSRDAANLVRRHVVLTAASGGPWSAAAQTPSRASEVAVQDVPTKTLPAAHPGASSLRRKDPPVHLSAASRQARKQYRRVSLLGRRHQGALVAHLAPQGVYGRDRPSRRRAPKAVRQHCGRRRRGGALQTTRVRPRATPPRTLTQGEKSWAGDPRYATCSRGRVSRSPRETSAPSPIARWGCPSQGTPARLYRRKEQVGSDRLQCGRV